MKSSVVKFTTVAQYRCYRLRTRVILSKYTQRNPSSAFGAHEENLFLDLNL